MGGRGSFSATHGGAARTTDGGSKIYIPETKETRADIRKLFIDELGFKELYGTEDIPTAQLGALGNAIKQQERQYHILSNNKVYFAAVNDKYSYGSAGLFEDGSMIMTLNPKQINNVGNYLKNTKAEQDSGFKSKIGNKITDRYAYTMRHEYGHLTQFDAGKRTGKSYTKISNEIKNIAKKNYGATSTSPSRYGKTSSEEYFAESFASMAGGKLSAHGKAMEEWLKKNKRSR